MSVKTLKGTMVTSGHATPSAPSRAVKKDSGQINLTDLWNPAMNSVWNVIAPFVIGKYLRGDIPPCKYDELFLQGGRACVDGDTLIATPNGDVKIKDFRGGELYSYDKNGNLVVAIGCASTRYEAEELYRVTTASGKIVECTAEHRFFTNRGWISCSDLREGDRLSELNCSRDISSSDFSKTRKAVSDLRASYYGGHLSKSREDAIRLSRTLLGSIYRCLRDFHLCDEQSLSEADTFQDVLQLLVGAQERSQACLRADDPGVECSGSHRATHERPRSSLDSLLRKSDRRCAISGSEICDMLSEWTSQIYSSSSQSQAKSNLVEPIREVAWQILDSRRLLSCQTEGSEATQILQMLFDTLQRSVADETYSDSFQNNDAITRNRYEYITLSEVVSIESIGKKPFYDIFVPFFNNYIGNGIVHHNSGKSYFASVIVWLALENDPMKNAVVIRKVASSLRKSCWKQMMKVRERLGYYHWKPNKTELTFTNERTGQQIFFVGLDDEEKVRSITVEKGYISIAWFEEAKQFSSMEEIDQAVSSLLRGGADSDENGVLGGDDCDDECGDMEYMTILTYNPPKSNFDWINKEARINKPTRLTHKSTYLTMPKKWLGRKVLNEIEAMKQTKPEQYKHMYLGMITGTGGEYFKNIKIRKITDEEIANFDYFNMGIDWGYNDPNIFHKTHIHDRKMYIFDEIAQTEIPSNGENKYEVFAREVKKHTRDCPDDTIWCDAQGKAEAEILRGPKFNIPVEFAPKQGVNGRDEGYSYFQGLDEIIIDPDRCPYAAATWPMFESKLAPGGKGWLDAPGTKGDHSPDACRYSEHENIAVANYEEDYDDDDNSIPEIEDLESEDELDEFSIGVNIDGVDFDD